MHTVLSLSERGFTLPQTLCEGNCTGWVNWVCTAWMILDEKGGELSQCR